MQDTIHLRAHGFALALSPQVGGSILSFDREVGEEVYPILRRTEGVPAKVTDTASFPLVPYVNRIRGGRFNFRGREVVLAPNMPPDISPLHGQGWLAAWEVASVAESSASFRFEHAPGEWPWAYEARQAYALDGDGLSLILSCRNLSDESMPCGLGQHPYFHCTAETRISTQVSHVWTIDENVLPVEKVPAEGPYDLTDLLLCGTDLDHGFAGWGGETRMHTPGVPFETIMSSPDGKFFQLYTPASGGFFVAEPVTHANAALNAPEEQWPELGMRVLAPGEEMVLHSRFDVQAI